MAGIMLQAKPITAAGISAMMAWGLNHGIANGSEAEAVQGADALI